MLAGSKSAAIVQVVIAVGFEPTTPSLKVMCSTG
jgi:hypothetical protein